MQTERATDVEGEERKGQRRAGGRKVERGRERARASATASEHLLNPPFQIRSTLVQHGAVGGRVRGDVRTAHLALWVLLTLGASVRYTPSMLTAWS